MHRFISKPWALAALGISLTLGSHLHAAAPESLFRFEFNEGAGNTVTNVSNTLIGAFGSPLLPDNYPIPNLDSPSGLPADKSLTIIDPSGFLQVDATGAAALSDFTKPLTVEGWVNVPSDAVLRNEAFVGYGGSWKLGFRANGSIAFTMFGIIDIESGVLVPAYDVWVHIAAVWEPGVGVTFYVNGTEAAVVAETRTIRAPIHNWLGIGSNGTDEPIRASIDRVRIHQAILTPEQLDSVAATPKAPAATTLIAFNFDEATPPYTSAGSINRPAKPAQDIAIANTSPTFTSDAPSRLASDKALVFDGNDRLLVPDPEQIFTLDETQNFTIQAWLKPGAQAGSKGVFVYNNGLGGAISAAITQSRQVMVTTLGRADTVTTAAFPNDGLWHHLGIIHENGVGYRIYIDGVLAATTPYTAGVLVDTRTETAFAIGSEGNGGLGYNGGLDRLEFFNKAIAPNELDFLAVPGVDPGAPELSIGTAVAISWPTVSTGFVLQKTTDLNEPRTWTDVPASTTVVDEKFYVFLPTTTVKTFYRLVRPPVAP